jgi:hypothetical protein
MISFTSSTFSGTKSRISTRQGNQSTKKKKKHTPEQTLQQHLRMVILQRSILMRHILEQRFLRRPLQRRSWCTVQAHLVPCAEEERSIGEPYRVVDGVRDETAREGVNIGTRQTERIQLAFRWRPWCTGPTLAPRQSRSCVAGRAARHGAGIRQRGWTACRASSSSRGLLWVHWAHVQPRGGK